MTPRPTRSFLTGSSKLAGIGFASEPDDVLFGRAEIERAFTALGERLARRGVVADVFVVGGAAMALAYDAARVTWDVGAVFMPHGIVVEKAPHGC